MAKKGLMALWKMLLQIALAALLLIGGISVFVYAGRIDSLWNYQDPLVKAIGSLFSGNARDIIVYIVAAIEIITGILLILDLLHLKNKTIDKLDDLFLLIIMILWAIVFVVIGDFVALFKGDISVVTFLTQLAKDAIMICVMGIIKREV